jgi:predicted O-methyltransferase YrrM
MTKERVWPDWFTGGYAEESFRRHLIPFVGFRDARFLQIGAYCGDASVWLAENILTGENTRLVDVDTWQGSNEIDHQPINFDDVFAFYKSRIPRNVQTFIGTSDAFFGLTHPPFDFIYVDGSHETHQVLRDAVNAERLLKPGGLLAFDDYMWGGAARNIPRPAIDAFLRCYEERIDVLEVGLQVWVRKR